MKKVAKKQVVKTRSILGKELSTKLPKEMIATIEVIEKFKGKKDVPFDTLYKEFLVELAKISSSTSNQKTRFRRLLYRNLESVLTKNSIQAAKFNLKANIKGIKIKSKNPILFKENQDAITSSVDTNFFTFQVNKVVQTNSELAITTDILERVANLKK